MPFRGNVGDAWRGRWGIRMRNMKLLALALSTTIVLACQSVTGTPNAVCAKQADDYGGTVESAHLTTIGVIRKLDPRQNVERPGLPAVPIRWPSLEASHPAVVCLIDGTFPVGPPPEPGQPAPEPATRAIVAVVDGLGELIVAGPRSAVPALPLGS
jgi:hypothetical protein